MNRSLAAQKPGGAVAVKVIAIAQLLIILSSHLLPFLSLPSC